jgi:hypothetical protein
MRTTDLKELIESVKRVRVEKCPALDEIFLLDVLAAEEANPEDEQSAMRAIEQALERALVRAGVE